MSFKRYDALRLFVETARYASFSEAAEALNMTKGAISYQINTLEQSIGFPLFKRTARGVFLTDQASELLDHCTRSFTDMETALSRLAGTSTQSLTIASSTYFAARWLSPRLMTFMQAYPDIQLRIQPMTHLFHLEEQGVDVAIRWGDGNWTDVAIEPLLNCPAWPTGNQAAADLVATKGLEEAFAAFTLLRDHDRSNAWSEWYHMADLAFAARKDTLIIPDPNVRVQAVINGQRVALNDSLSFTELQSASLVRLSDQALENYGYFLAYSGASLTNPAVKKFADWARAEALANPIQI